MNERSGIRGVSIPMDTCGFAFAYHNLATGALQSVLYSGETIE
ncbi:MAG: hypothetical protein ACYTHJ_07735 [Planctomycetota bacterium]|jgi:hypothetical protein